MQDWMSSQISHLHNNEEGNGNVQVKYYRKSLLLEPRETASRPTVDTSAASIVGVAGTRADLFSWISRDRGTSTPTPTHT